MTLFTIVHSGRWADVVHTFFKGFFMLQSLSGALVLAEQGSAGVAIFLFVYLAILAVMIVGTWKMYEKAGQPGWGVLIPIYNAVLFCRAAGRPGWWVILYFIPLVNLIISIIVMIDLAKRFGKGVGFAIGLILLGVVFIPILGFGSAQYQGDLEPVRL